METASRNHRRAARHHRGRRRAAVRWSPLAAALAVVLSCSDRSPTGLDDHNPEEADYTATLLGTMGLDRSTPTDVNAQCRVVGWAAAAGASSTPFVWDPGRGMRPIEMDGMGTSPDGVRAGAAGGVNDRGTVVGWAATHDPDGHAVNRAFAWSESEGGRFFEPLDGYGHTFTTANGINDEHVVAGVSWTPSNVGHPRASVWGASEEPTELLRLEGTRDGDDTREEVSASLAINNRGSVAGFSGTVPVIWVEPDRPQPLELPDGATHGAAAGLNDTGDVVGTAWGRLGSQKIAVLWRDGRPIELSVPDGHWEAEAWAVTEADPRGVIRITGASRFRQGGTVRDHAVVWTVDGESVTVKDLGPPEGYVHARATGIAMRDGRVLVSGVVAGADGVPTATLWTSAEDACDR